MSVQTNKPLRLFTYHTDGIWMVACEFFYHSLADNFLCRLTYLDNRLGSVSDSRGEEYAPVAAYRHSLLMGEVDTTVQSTKLTVPTTGAKRRGAKRKLIADGESGIACCRISLQFIQCFITELLHTFLMHCSNEIENFLSL